MLSRPGRRAALAGLALLASSAAACAQATGCLSTGEAREAAAAHRLADSVAVMRTAALEARAEALSARLCRWNGEFVYEITLLRRDGRVARTFRSASDGTAVGQR